MRITARSKLFKIANIFTFERLSCCENMASASSRNYTSGFLSKGTGVAYKKVTPSLLSKYMPFVKGGISFERPGVVFCPGYMSDMEGQKAKTLLEHCKANKTPYVCFDYRGCGKSPGNFEECTLTTWKEDLCSVLDHLTKGPQILIGSSMGAWLSLLVAMERPLQIAAVIGIGSAPDFPTRRIKQLSKQEREKLDSEGKITVNSPYVENYIFTKKFYLDSEQYNILDRENYPIHCPVLFLHGLCDEVAPAEAICELAGKFQTVGVRVDCVFQDDSDHRLSSPVDLVMIKNALERVVIEYNQQWKSHFKDN